MRRLLVSILAFLYLCTASGATVTLHYCMGKLVNASVAHNTDDDDHECSSCGMTKKKSAGCCKDEHKVLKTDPAHHGGKVELAPVYVAHPPAPVQTVYSYPAYRPYTGTIHLCCHAPPGFWRSCPIYKQINNFRI